MTTRLYTTDQCLSGKFFTERSEILDLNVSDVGNCFLSSTLNTLFTLIRRVCSIFVHELAFPFVVCFTFIPCNRFVINYCLGIYFSLLSLLAIFLGAFA